MFKVQSKDGSTVHVDLNDESQARDILRRLRDPSQQAELTALTIAQPSRGRPRCPECSASGRFLCPKCGQVEGEVHAQQIQYTLARPEGFHHVFMWPEAIEPDGGKVKGGECITCFVDDIRVQLMVHRSQPSIRVSLLKTGRQRYNPLIDT